MANPLLGEILSAALGRGRGGLSANQPSSPMGGIGTAALGGLLASMMRRGGSGGMRPSNNRGMLLAMLLPLAMNWVQRNGGLGSVLDKFRRSGMGAQANSWVSTGPNHDVSPEDVRQVVGRDEIAQLAGRLGVSEDEVSQAFSEILPELTDKLTPEGQLRPEADEALQSGQDALQTTLRDLHEEMERKTIP